MADIFPAKLTAGLTFDHLVTLTAYPAPDWSLSVALRGASVINLTAVADGAQHRLVANAAATGAYVPGLYSYSARVTRDGVVIGVDAGTVEILPDLAAQTGTSDVRSHSRIVLDNIRAVIEKRATQDQEKYVINNRELWRTPLRDLLHLESTYAARVRAEEAKERGQSGFASVRMRLA